jgi:hypothetical protein
MASFCVEAFGLANLKDLNEEKINLRAKRFIDLVAFDLK